MLVDIVSSAVIVLVAQLVFSPLAYILLFICCSICSSSDDDAFEEDDVSDKVGMMRSVINKFQVIMALFYHRMDRKL